MSLLAKTARLTDLLPHLHQQALDLTGGDCVLLFEHNSRTGVLHATSGYGLESLRTDAWTASEEEERCVEETLRQNLATLVPDLEHEMPDLSLRLGKRAALLLPLARADERVGLIAIGFAEAPDLASYGEELEELQDAFLVTLEWFRLRRNDELQREVRELLDVFNAALSTSLQIGDALEQMCAGANRLFAADRTSVWIHDRRSRRLELQASSEAVPPAAVHVSVDDPFAPAAIALRGSRAELSPASVDGENDAITVPLRGCRRALGTMIFEGVRVESGGELEWLDRADQLGRQVSSAIETMQLLDAVVRARRQVEDIFNSMTDLIAVSDSAGRIIQANDAFASRVSIPREQLADRMLSTTVGHELASWLEVTRAGRGAPGHDQAGREIVDSVLGGPLLVTLSPLHDRDQRVTGRVLIARDLTPQTRREAERREFRDQIVQSEKLAALGQFVAGIAHELNNPLQAVLGNLELLRTHEWPESLAHDLATIYREADRAAEVVRNLLAFAGARRATRQPLNITALLEQVLEQRRAATSAQNVEIVRHYGEKLPRVRGDALLLQQVFLNMVRNAEQAVASTGRPGRIEVAATSGARGYVVVTVRDTGVGISSDAMSRLFEPFYTTRDVGKGTGLGLAIAYGIIQDHGGHISAANDPTGGAVFTIELPSEPPS